MAGNGIKNADRSGSYLAIINEQFYLVIASMAEQSSLFSSLSSSSNVLNKGDCFAMLAMTK